MKWILIVISSVLLLSSCQGEPASEIRDEKPLLQMSILKVGKADTIILQMGKHTVVIDTAEDDDGEEILAFLEKQQITKIDTLIITHFDKDHVGGADQLIENMEVGQLLLPNYEGTHKEYKEFMEVLASTAITPTNITDTYTFAWDDVELTIYPPKQSSYDGDNDYSLVTAIKVGDIQMLLAGDAEQQRLQELLDEDIGSFDLLKVPHHGRWNDSSQAFFDMVQPAFAIITSSDKNMEEPEVIQALELLGTDIWLSRKGDIHLTTDGEEISITQ